MSTHTQREIWQQPATWTATTETVRQCWALRGFLKRAGLPDRATRLRLGGAGSSDFVCAAFAPLLKRQWQREVLVTATTDLLTDPAFFHDASPELWLSFSRSGDSPEAVFAVDQALKLRPATHHLIVTCNREARVLQAFGSNPRVFSIVLADEVNDRSLAMTSSFTNLVMAGQALAHLDAQASYVPLAAALCSAAGAILPSVWDLTALLAARQFKRVLFLGSSALRAAARESSLKVTELSGGAVMSFHESFLGLRHGPMAGIDQHTLIVAFLSAEHPRRSYELDLLTELRTKGLGGRTVVVGPELGTLDHLYDDSIAIPAEIPDLYRPPLDVLIGQCLGFHTAVSLGLDPDNPSRSGIIRRTVPPIALYPL